MRSPGEKTDARNLRAPNTHLCAMFLTRRRARRLTLRRLCCECGVRNGVRRAGSDRVAGANRIAPARRIRPPSGDGEPTTRGDLQHLRQVEPRGDPRQGAAATGPVTGRADATSGHLSLLSAHPFAGLQQVHREEGEEEKRTKATRLLRFHDPLLIMFNTIILPDDFEHPISIRDLTRAR